MNVQEFENKRWSTKPQGAEFRHITTASLISQGSVLDVGCGDGLLLSMLKDKGIEAEGIDLSDVAVEHCRAQGLTAMQGDFTDALPHADQSFDTVVALDVLEHVYDPTSLLCEMKRVARKEIIIGVPNFSSLPARLQTLLGRVPENNAPHKGHIYWFNWNVLQAILAKNDLKISSHKSNTPWERVPIIGSVTKSLAHFFPNIFALSFIVVCTR